MTFLLRCLGWLPLPMLYPLGRLIAFVAFDVMRWHRELADRNLANSMPELSAEQRRRILGRGYRNLGQTLVEAIWGWCAGGPDLAPRVTIDRPELVDHYVAGGRPVVLLAAHMCNWEWLLLATGAKLGLPIDPVYKPLRVASVEEYVRAARSRFGGRPIPIDHLLFDLMSRSGPPRAYGMLADQTPPQDAAKHWRRFLNQDTAFYAGMGMIARYLDAPVIYVAMRRRARGYYDARIHVLTEPPYESDPEAAIVDRYCELLETEIRANPWDWLWVHRKWKYPKPPEA